MAEYLSNLVKLFIFMHDFSKMPLGVDNLNLSVIFFK